ncbi:hypothetical protein P879_00020 [Paragonimus westermani]|uniref:Uncharacterized protein n=1 Tax=Paragonimus westermani TaxID=34504 RepID=A0A8T0DXF1_9TREM|nr:hypothetical protein P879_00020 [Paragonimus westermani]
MLSRRTLRWRFAPPFPRPLPPLPRPDISSQSVSRSAVTAMVLCRVSVHAMNTCSFPRSNLDVSAPEFVPFEKPQQKDSKQATIRQLKEMIEPVFQGNNSSSEHIFQIKPIALAKNVNAPRLIGEVLGDLVTVTPARSSVGFRFVTKLLAVLSVTDGQELQAGLIGSVDGKL